MNLKKSNELMPYYFNAFVTLCAVIIFYLLVSDVVGVKKLLLGIISIFKPFIVGFAFAYILNIPYKKIKSFLNIKSEKSKAIVSLIITYLSFATLLTAFLMLVVPELIVSLSSLIQDFPKMAAEVVEFLEAWSLKLGISEQVSDTIMNNSSKIMETMFTSVSSLLPKVTDLLSTLITGFTDLFLSFIISIYMLIDKEKLLKGVHKVRMAFLKEGHNVFLDKLSLRANKIFGGFLVGQLLDSFVVSMLNLVMMLLLSIPYAFLIAVIVLFTNIIPFFGSALGMVPSFILILFVSPQKAIIYLIMALIIQQIDGNYIGPKILGESLGISPFWVLFALLVSGNLFGFFGLLLGVPTFALIASFFKDLLNEKLTVNRD